MNVRQQEWLALKIAEWREHPAQMVRELFGVEPDNWQEEVLEKYGQVPRLAMKSAKGPGKSAVLSWLAWNFLLTRPFPKVAATSISGDNLSDGLWSEMAKWMHADRTGLLSAMFEWSSTNIRSKEHPAVWFMTARTWPKTGSAQDQANTLAGIHADYCLFLLDESGAIPDSVMAAALAVLTSGVEAHVVQAGNPTNLSGPLYRACVLNRDLWYVVEITGDPDNPRRSKRIDLQYAKDTIREWGRDHPYVKVNILGEFPPASLNALIGPDEVRAAFGRYYSEFEIGRAPRIIGVDVSRYGDDESVLAFREGLQAYKFRGFRNINGDEGASIVNRECARWEPDAVFLDGTGGWGSSWEDNLRRLGRSPISVQFNAAPHEKLKFENKRAEMYWSMVEWIKRGGALPPDEDFLKELTETTYSIPKDVIILEPKRDLKARIGRSPDRADALCFVAGTMIATPSGPVAIEDLRVGDVVLTPFGSSSIVRTWTSETERLTDVAFSNGSALRGRPEHKIFVYGAGAIRLDALPFTMAVSTLKERDRWLSASRWFTAVRNIGFRTLVDISPAGSLLTANVCCIVGFGLITTGRFQRATRFITRIEIGATVRSIILSFSRKMSTTRFMLKSAASSVSSLPLAGTWSESSFSPSNGTLQRKDERGILSMEKRRGLDESRLVRCVRDAVGPTGLFFLREVDFVQSPASRLRRFVDILRTCAPVIGAGRLLRRIVTGRRRAVPVSVETDCVPPTSVYNLTLVRDNAYYANEILVFNCLTFAEPVEIQRSGARSRQMRADYDPFAGMDGGLDAPQRNNYSVGYDPFGG